MNNIWALTGGIACGKSTVSNILKELGWVVIDCDDISHKLLEPGEINWKNIINFFGKEYLNSDNTIDRKKLGNYVFKNKETLLKLDELTHPNIILTYKKYIEEFNINNKNKSLIVIIPLLFEKKLNVDFENILCVSSSIKNQKLRMKSRGLNDIQIKDRLRSQMPIYKKVKLSNCVIFNNSDLNELTNQIKEFILRYE